jgi:hypothetical protein
MRATFGARDYTQWFAPVVTTAVPADPMRRFLRRDEIVAELRDTAASPGPVGHGYPEDPDLTHGAHYAYDAIPGLLRMIVLDSSDKEGGSPGLVERSTVEQWLVPELERAAADGMLAMVASHHSPTSMDRKPGREMEASSEAIAPGDLEQVVASHPNVIAWLVGHSHNNRIRAIADEDGTHPGYWEIMTSALADWPSQGRLIELVHNGNGTLSIFATLTDYDTQSCMERRFRRLTLLDYQAAWADDYSRAPENSNVELVLPVPDGAVSAVQNAADSAPARIESETTLRGQR